MIDGRGGRQGGRVSERDGESAEREEGAVGRILGKWKRTINMKKILKGERRK